MNAIQGVSLPRSGHNLLVRHLQSYFASHDICRPTRKRRLVLPFPSRTEPRSTSSRSPFHYCEYYYSCRCRPCRHPHNAFQKSHDFKLDLPVEHSRKHLVQVRDTTGLLISWFEMRLARGRENDSAEGFQTFMQRQQKYVEGFRRKWVTGPVDHRLVLNYDEYLRRPVETLSRVVSFFAPDQPIHRQRIAEIVTDIRPPRIDSQFRYYHAIASMASV